MEQKNKESWWKKLLGLNPIYNYIFFICFFVVLITLSIYLISSYAKTKDKEIAKQIVNEDYIKNKAIKQIKISTPEESKEKGLHYIGEMTTRRVNHITKDLGNNQILIIGGDEKNTAEIFNTANGSFHKLKSHPTYSNYINAFWVDNEKLLLTGNNFEFFNKKNMRFNSNINLKILNNKKSQGIIFSEKMGESIIQCNYSEQVPECWDIKLNNLKSQVILNNKVDLLEDSGAGIFSQTKIDDNIIIFSKYAYIAHHAPNMPIIFYDVSKKRFLNKFLLKNIGKYYKVINSSPIILDKDNILFLGGIQYEICRGLAVCMYELGDMYYSQSQIYDYKKNQVVKKLNYLFSDVIIPITPIKLSNNNILIVEKNKIRQIYNYKEMTFEPTKNIEQLDVYNFNVLSLNKNQILITGGQDIVTNKVSKSAWIYTY